jgi:hypothetical protein
MWILILVIASLGLFSWWYTRRDEPRNGRATEPMTPVIETAGDTATPLASKTTRSARASREHVAQFVAPVLNNAKSMARTAQARVRQAGPPLAVKLNSTAQAARTVVTHAADPITTAVQARQARFARQERQPTQFRDWIADAHLIDRPGLYVNFPESIQNLADWAQGLSEQELKMLAETTARFLADAQIEFAWLLDGQLAQSPDLLQPVEEAVALFAVAYRRVTRLQDRAREFAAFRAWQDDLGNPKNHELTRRLFTKLLEGERVPPPAPDLLMATEEARQSYFEQTLQEFMTKDRPAFDAVFRETAFAPAPRE